MSRNIGDVEPLWEGLQRYRAIIGAKGYKAGTTPLAADQVDGVAFSVSVFAESLGLQLAGDCNGSLVGSSTAGILRLPSLQEASGTLRKAVPNAAQ